jgi:hypothetical protein
MRGFLNTYIVKVCRNNTTKYYGLFYYSTRAIFWLMDNNYDLINCEVINLERLTALRDSINLDDVKFFSAIRFLDTGKCIGCFKYSHLALQLLTNFNVDLTNTEIIKVELLR